MPDISTIDAFKQTLLVARSIVYADPAKGGASGVYFPRPRLSRDSGADEGKSNIGHGRPGC
jgi:molybdate transport system substrate-binding protein